MSNQSFTLIIICFLSIIISSCEKEINYTDLYKKDGLMLYNSTNEPFSGKCILKDSKKRVIIESHYKNGYKHGTFKRFFRDGKINIDANYDNEKLIYSTTFYKTGKKQRYSFYNDSVLVKGEWTEFGTLFCIQEMLSDSIANGRMVLLDDFGKTQSCLNYKNGLKNDLFIGVHDNGKINIAGYYLNDLQHNTWRLFNEKGKLIACEKYNAGKKVGEWQYFYDNGIIKSEIVFSNSKIIRKTEFNEKGERVEEFTSEN